MSIYRPSAEDIARHALELIEHKIATMTPSDLHEVIGESDVSMLLAAMQINDHSRTYRALRDLTTKYFLPSAKNAAREWANDIEADEKHRHGYHTHADKRIGAYDR